MPYKLMDLENNHQWVITPPKWRKTDNMYLLLEHPTQTMK